jgi:hypothetical protein
VPKQSHAPLLQEATELVAIFTVAVRKAKQPPSRNSGLGVSKLGS